MYLHSARICRAARGELCGRAAAFSACAEHLRDAIRPVARCWRPLSRCSRARMPASATMPAARREQSRAVAIHERVGGPNHPFVANALTDLANVYREEGLPAQALASARNVPLPSGRRTSGPDHRDVARTLADMASTLMQSGSDDAGAGGGHTCRRHLGAARHTRRTGLRHSPRALCRVAGTSGGRRQQRGTYFERAMAIRAKVFGTSNPEYAIARQVSRWRSRISETARPPSAMPSAPKPQGAPICERCSGRCRNASRSTMRQCAREALDLILSLTQSTPEAVDAAMDGLIRSRALVLDEMAARHRSQRTPSRAPIRFGSRSPPRSSASRTSWCAGRTSCRRLNTRHVSKTHGAKARWRSRRSRNGVLNSGRSAVGRNSASTT